MKNKPTKMVKMVKLAIVEKLINEWKKLFNFENMNLFVVISIYMHAST